jgi:hypothetical protein
VEDRHGPPCDRRGEADPPRQRDVVFAQQPPDCPETGDQRYLDGAAGRNITYSASTAISTRGRGSCGGALSQDAISMPLASE